jgi:hypothetical protein
MHELFIGNNPNQSLLHLYDWQRGEPKPCTTTLNSRDDLIHVIANNAKSDILGVLLNNATKGSLGLLGHHVCFVQDNELEPFCKEGASFGKLFDLFTDDIDATVIRGIEL